MFLMLTSFKKLKVILENYNLAITFYWRITYQNGNVWLNSIRCNLYITLYKWFYSRYVTPICQRQHWGGLLVCKEWNNEVSQSMLLLLHFCSNELEGYNVVHLKKNWSYFSSSVASTFKRDFQSQNYLSMWICPNIKETTIKLHVIKVGQ